MRLNCDFGSSVELCSLHLPQHTTHRTHASTRAHVHVHAVGDTLSLQELLVPLLNKSSNKLMEHPCTAPAPPRPARPHPVCPNIMLECVWDE